MFFQDKCDPVVGRTAFSRTLLVNNVARRLGLSRRMVRHLAKTGQLRAQKLGKKIWTFVPADVDEFQARRETRHV
jgi:excisionase family DNA binding protein